MRNTPASKLPTRKLLGAVIAATLFIPTSGFTLGLGEIEVNSALNQKLSADIELLSTTPDDSENIIVKLASRKAFTRAGLDRPYALNDLRFKAEIINGVPHIKVTSGSPIREPFLNFLVEVDWPNGHLLREYTVLLDPPVFMTQAASAPVQQARLDSRPSPRGTIYATPAATTAAPVARAPVVRQPVVQQPTAWQPVERQPVNQPQVKQTRVQAAPAIRQPVQQQAIQQQVEAVWNPPVASEYRIKKGDTAWSLAESMRPDQSVSVEQMMVAMLQHNPESFIDGNINGLRRGYVLRVPDYEQIASVSKNSAKALVRNQAALWRQYQQAKTGGQLASAMEKNPSQPVDSRAASSQAVKEDDAHLAIVSAGTGASTASSKDPTEMTAAELRAELSLARERIETERVEKEGLQKTLSQLKSSAKKVKGMFSIEDDQLSDVQAMNLPADGTQAETKLGETLNELKEAAKAKVNDTTKDMQDTAQSAVNDAATKTNEMVDSVKNADDALFVDEAATQKGENNTTVEQKTAGINEVTPPQTATKGVQSWIDQIINNPVISAAVGGGLLLLLGLFGWMFKRGKSEADTAVVSGFDDLESLAEEVAEEQATESVVEDEFDTTTSMDVSDASAVDEVATAEDNENNQEEADEEEPRDDVIAEADVYLAYGIYQQAEELLVPAIAENPDRNDYRLKLAEVHYASKNANAFVQTTTELKGKVEEDSSIWKKVLVMGQSLCPDNEMFQSSLMGGLELDSDAPQVPEMDLDLGLDAVSEIEADTTTEAEAIGEISELELPEMESLADIEDDAEAAVSEPAEELEFDLSDTGAIEEPEESLDNEEFSIDIETSELDISDADEDADIDFGLTEEVAEESAVEEPVEETLVEAIAVMDDEEEISLDLTEDAEVLDITPHADVDEEISIDMGEAADSFDLNLDDDSIEIISDSEADDDEFDLSALDDVDEISTKLDLARAYLDMGDTEGTRSILEEVVAEGNDDQKDEANILMAKLG